MKTFENQACQGDMMLIRIESLPENLIAGEQDDLNYIITHSESGHNHVIEKQEGVEFYQSANDNFKAYIVVDNVVHLKHLRGFDTHETIEIKKGIYEVRRQREYTPEGFRRAID